MKVEWRCRNVDAALFNTVCFLGGVGWFICSDNGIEMSSPGDEMWVFIFILFTLQYRWTCFKSTYILKFSKQDALFSSFYLSFILDCFIWPYRTKSRNIWFYNCCIFQYIVICFTEYAEDWHWCVNLEHIRYFIFPAFNQYGNIWYVILVGVTLFDDVPVTLGRLNFQSHTPSFCFLTSEITTIWRRDRSVAHTLRLTILDLQFASNGKY